MNNHSCMYLWSRVLQEFNPEEVSFIRTEEDPGYIVDFAKQTNFVRPARWINSTNLVKMVQRDRPEVFLFFGDFPLQNKIMREILRVCPVWSVSQTGVSTYCTRCGHEYRLPYISDDPFASRVNWSEPRYPFRYCSMFCDQNRDSQHESSIKELSMIHKTRTRETDISLNPVVLSFDDILKEQRKAYRTQTKTPGSRTVDWIFLTLPGGKRVPKNPKTGYCSAQFENKTFCNNKCKSNSYFCQIPSHMAYGGEN